jgi:hypothetical protein
MLLKNKKEGRINIQIGKNKNIHSPKVENNVNVARNIAYLSENRNHSHRVQVDGIHIQRHINAEPNYQHRQIKVPSVTYELNKVDRIHVLHNDKR